MLPESGEPGQNSDQGQQKSVEKTDNAVVVAGKYLVQTSKYQILTR